MEDEWMQYSSSFEAIDLREIEGHFFSRFYPKAEELNKGEGLHVIQNFEPLPLYDTMTKLGYLRHTEKRNDGTYDIYFYRAEVRE